MESVMPAAVFVQTNDAAANEVVAFGRSDAGTLSLLGRYATGGRGTGEPHLPSQNSVVLGDDGRWLFVANAGSDELSLFTVEPDGLRLADRVASGGEKPTSVAGARRAGLRAQQRDAKHQRLHAHG
jgi:6-phosphogluconolactonase